MLNNFIIVATQVLILFIQMGVGYYCYKKEKITDTVMGSLTYLILNICLPCSIFNIAAGLENTAEFWRSFALAAGINIVFHFLKILISIILTKMYDKRMAATYQMCTLYGSAAFMGIPLVTALFGGEGAIFLSLFSTIETVILFVHVGIMGGIYSDKGGQKITAGFIVKKIFSNVTIALLLGFVFCLSGISVPRVVTSVCSSLGAVVSPVAMMIVGCQLAKVNIREVISKPTNYYIAAIKLVILPAILMAILYFFKNSLPFALVSAYVVASTTAQGPVVASLCEQNGLDGKAAASVIGLTTFLSIITMPLMCSIFITLFA